MRALALQSSQHPGSPTYLQSPNPNPMRSSRILTSTSAALLLGVLPLVAGHEEHGDMSMHMDAAATATAVSNTTALVDTRPNYFRHPHYTGWIYAHIALMLLAWVVVMPLAMMLSMARSRYHLPAQLVRLRREI